MRAGDHDGMLLTIHDTKVEDIEVVARELPEAVFDSIEVYYDFTPKGALSLTDKHQRIEMVRQWILTHLYPWQGVGIQEATRVSSGPRHAEAVFNGDIERRAENNETLYFGHAKRIHANRDKANYAFMRLYNKKTDNKKALSPDKYRCRVEVNLNSMGCEHFGLTDPSSLFGFDFRKLGPYFRLVKPEVRISYMRKLRKWNIPMAELLESKRTRMAADTLRDVGSHAAIKNKLINVDGHHRHSEGNRMIQVRLDDLTRKFKKGRS